MPHCSHYIREEDQWPRLLKICLTLFFNKTAIMEEQVYSLKYILGEEKGIGNRKKSVFEHLFLKWHSSSYQFLNWYVLVSLFQKCVSFFFHSIAPSFRNLNFLESLEVEWLLNSVRDRKKKGKEREGSKYTRFFSRNLLSLSIAGWSLILSKCTEIVLLILGFFLAFESERKKRFAFHTLKLSRKYITGHDCCKGDDLSA